MFKTVAKAFRWLWSHFGWGWHGWNIDKVSWRRINADRQALKAYCAEFGITRKAAKKGFRHAAMDRKNWANIRRARRDAYLAGREPIG